MSCGCESKDATSSVGATGTPQKTQLIRVADVALIGPAMIAGGLALAPQRQLLGWFLFGSGVATVIYNARNWVAKE